MASSNRDRVSVLITGCSPGGMGAALAIAFHEAGHQVFATARNPTKLQALAERGIATVTLDITSTESIAAAVASVTSSLKGGKGLDILVNNAAGSYAMPVVDISLDKAKQLFETNVWSHVAVTQAFLPLLLKSERPVIVNHTSVGSMAAVPWQGVYNASKAALAMLTDTMRMELSGFGIRVVDLKTGGVKTNIIDNNNFHIEGDKLPEGSIFAPAREAVQKAIGQEDAHAWQGMTAEQWADEVVGLLLKRNPPAVVWKGSGAFMSRIALLFPGWVMEGVARKITNMNAIEEVIRASRK
ncbi:short chain dehydrogenase [Stachybotrys elegans]|uniref:Short chain dehydrogenase n=1 Tax=Stachybotrys elegans TaxID=80388 RepID=A0A8K0SNQ4_9HYPO|nr:short chain dehydrogenase [Stachybotrys elegans]